MRPASLLLAAILASCAAQAGPLPPPTYVSDPADRHGWRAPWMCYRQAACVTPGTGKVRT